MLPKHPETAYTGKSLLRAAFAPRYGFDETSRYESTTVHWPDRSTPLPEVGRQVMPRPVLVRSGPHKESPTVISFLMCMSSLSLFTAYCDVRQLELKGSMLWVSTLFGRRDGETPLRAK